jgi:hypothetical protein
LKIQFKKLVEPTNGKIFTKNLLSLIDKYETNEHVVLLTEIQKKAILPYTKLNPDLEMTPDDILNLLKLVCPSPMVASISAPTVNLDVVRPRTSSPLTSFTRKRRPSAVATDITTTIIPCEDQQLQEQQPTEQPGQVP